MTEPIAQSTTAGTPAASGEPRVAALRDHTGLLVILFVGAFLSALNVSLLSPLVVAIAERFGVSDAAAGQLATLSAVLAGATAFIVAPLADRFPRGLWLRVLTVTLAAGSILCAFAPAFGWLFVGRAIAGVGGSVIGATCIAACADLYPEPNVRNRALGIINTAFTFGAVFGLPLVTQLGAWLGWRWAIALPVPIAALIFIGSFRLPNRSRPIEGTMREAWLSGYRVVLHNRETLWLLGAISVSMSVWYGWIIYFGAMSDKLYSVGPTLLTVLFLAGGGAEVLGNNVVASMVRRWNSRTVGSVGALICAVDLLLIGVLWNSGIGLFPFIMIQSACGAIAWICVSIALIDSAPKATGAVMALQSASLQAGGAIGVALSGLALTLMHDDYAAVYRLLGLAMPLMAVTLIISGRSHRKQHGG